MRFQKPKGTKDILPKDIHKWQFVENIIRNIMELYNFSEIRTPTFENTELFARGVGNETDIVGKEMYTFLDKGGNSITLRPEMTASVMRAYIENGFSNDSAIQKLYYLANMFRHENPQKGRYREHTQFGAEIIGSDSVLTDIEIISLAKEVYNRCGINKFTVNINSIGKKEERNKYIEILKEYLNKYYNDLSSDSQRRLNTNPLRILDSKNENDIKITESAPKILDNLSVESRERFDKVLKGLSDLKIEYYIDFRIVRGLDYYTDTTFEFISKDLGAQDALGGGGRYDGLSEILGGKPTPGVGFASGVERMILVAEKNNFNFTAKKPIKVYFITLNEQSRGISLKLSNELRNHNISCETDLLSRSFKAQMREANKLNAVYSYIIGDEEIKNEKGLLKNMSDGTQKEMPFNEIKNYLLKENAN